MCYHISLIMKAKRRNSPNTHWRRELSGDERVVYWMSNNYNHSLPMINT